MALKTKYSVSAIYMVHHVHPFRFSLHNHWSWGPYETHKKTVTNQHDNSTATDRTRSDLRNKILILDVLEPCIRRFTTCFLPTRLMRRRMNRQVWLSGLRGKNERKKDLIDWMRASGPRHPGFIASNGRVAGQRTEQSSHFQDQPFLHGHFFSLELLPPKKRIRDAFNAYTLLIMLYTVA